MVIETRTSDRGVTYQSSAHSTTSALSNFVFRCSVMLYGEDCGAGIRQQIRRAQFVQKFLYEALAYVTE